MNIRKSTLLFALASFTFFCHSADEEEGKVRDAIENLGDGTGIYQIRFDNIQQNIEEPELKRIMLLSLEEEIVNHNARMMLEEQKQEANRREKDALDRQLYVEQVMEQWSDCDESDSDHEEFDIDDLYPEFYIDIAAKVKQLAENAVRSMDEFVSSIALVETFDRRNVASNLERFSSYEKAIADLQREKSEKILDTIVSKIDEELDVQSWERTLAECIKNGEENHTTTKILRESLHEVTELKNLVETSVDDARPCARRLLAIDIEEVKRFVATEKLFRRKV